ncbi:hypothetical protein AK812_SmicGene37540 [Symbiodinium microadriaticum]|uniref:Calcineurin-like phosphoesterase domain-containing protein n=1 Tax=Symbiodinium microadriaticum TaxID=2951 RepID=A0A1Q9CG11_SYMMI|nr:hypothetical protein AK812_SmicGene37540 [Symbiodinium microadriaticum]
MASAVPSPVAVPTLQGPIGFVSDLEGNLHLWECYLELSEVLRRSDDGKIELAEAAHFVFGGDAVDHYPGDLQILEDLLDLKRRYPDRVHLIIGNRPLALAFRSNWPLEKHPGVYWLGEESRPSATMAKEDLRSNGSAAHLRWILSETLGARKAFENRRQELQKRGLKPEARLFQDRKMLVHGSAFLRHRLKILAMDEGDQEDFVDVIVAAMHFDGGQRSGCYHSQTLLLGD